MKCYILTFFLIDAVGFDIAAGSVMYFTSFVAHKFLCFVEVVLFVVVAAAVSTKL